MTGRSLLGSDQRGHDPGIKCDPIAFASTSNHARVFDYYLHQNRETIVYVSRKVITALFLSKTPPRERQHYFN